MVISWFTSNNKKELLAPYFQEIAKQTVDAAKDNDRVVLSHATYSEVCRDIVIETIVAGGVPREHITLVELVRSNQKDTLKDTLFSKRRVGLPCL